MKIFSLLLLCFFSACSASQHIVAKVNGESLLDKDVAAQLRIELSKYDDLSASDRHQQEVVRGQILERMVMDRLLLQEAKKRGIHVTPDDFFNFLSKQRLSEDEAKQHLESIGVSYEFWRRQQEQRLIIEKLLDQVLAEKLPISPEDISHYYRTHLPAFTVPARYHARQILLSNLEVAQKVFKLLKQGDDFTKLAKEYSQSPDKEKGGVMGWLSRNNAPETFIEALAKLRPGELSPPTKTDYGYHVFQLLDKSPAHEKPLPEAESEIMHTLQGEQGNELLKSWLKDLRDHAKVEIDQAALSLVTLKE